VDLDTVEPAYTLRPIATELKNMGVEVVTQPDNFGLGEAASYITPAQVNCLNSNNNIIIDVGYGAGGLDILDIINNIDKETDLRIYLVVNTAKFETSTVDNIIEYVTFSEGLEKRPWKKFSGLISNTHFGDETTKDDIINGYQKLKKAAEILNLPINAIGVAENLSTEFGKTYDNTEVWVYNRMMPRAFW
jgi:tetrahydromethanopterin S-methyltransferase subunit F